MPGRAWYWIAAAIFVVGASAAAIFLWSRLTGLENQLTQVLVPGSADVVLEKPGTYTIFHEKVSVFDGRYYTADSISGLTFAVATLPDGTPVALTVPGASTSYQIAGRSGVGVLAFEIVEPGSYRLSARYDDGRQEPKTVLAIGRNFVGNLLATIFGSLAIGFASAGIAIAIATVTYLKRRAAIRASAPAASQQ